MPTGGPLSWRSRNHHGRYVAGKYLDNLGDVQALVHRPAMHQEPCAGLQPYGKLGRRLGLGYPCRHVGKAGCLNADDLAGLDGNQVDDVEQVAANVGAGNPTLGHVNEVAGTTEVAEREGGWGHKNRCAMLLGGRTSMKKLG